MLAGKAGNASRHWKSAKECWVKVCSETLSLIVLPSVLARGAVSGSRLSQDELMERGTIAYSAASSACERGGQWWQAFELLKECRANMCTETRSPAIPPSVLVRKTGSGSRLWSSSKNVG